MNDQTAVITQEFSLGKGAEYVGVSKATLRAAYEKGEIPGVKSLAGLYSFKHLDLEQYRQNRTAAQVKAMNHGIQPPVTPATIAGAAAGMQGFGLPHDAVPRDLHEQIVDSLEKRLADKDARIESEVADKAHWRNQSKSVQNLLTHQRAEEADNDEFMEDEILTLEQSRGGATMTTFAIICVSAIMLIAAIWMLWPVLQSGYDWLLSWANPSD